MMKKKRFIGIWGWPILLALLSALGLLSALLGVGIWQWLSWAALTFPLLMMGYCWKKSSGSCPPSSKRC